MQTIRWIIDGLIHLVGSAIAWAIVCIVFIVIVKVIVKGLTSGDDFLDRLFPKRVRRIWYESVYVCYPENWEFLRQEVLKRDNNQCAKCSKSKAKGTILQVHHIVPLSKGGSNDLDNLQTLCLECHEEIHPHMKEMQA